MGLTFSISADDCQFCEKEHARDAMYGRWFGSCYFLYRYRQKISEPGIEIAKTGRGKTKAVPRLDRLSSSLQRSSK